MMALWLIFKSIIGYTPRIILTMMSGFLTAGKHMTNRTLTVMPCFLMLLGANCCYADTVIEKQFSTRVEAGKSKAIKLENVAVATRLELTAKSAGALDVLVLDELNYSLYPNVHNFLYSGSLDSELEVSLLSPASGDYFLVFDNREGTGELRVEVNFKASRAQFVPLENEALTASMDSIVTSLSKLFRFDRIVVEPVSCGFANLLVVDDHIYLCIEYVTMLKTENDEAASAKSLLLFAILHEMAHVLLRQWDMPFYANEEIADQLATALAGMMGRTPIVLAQADFFKRLASAEKEAGKRTGFGRHPLVAQRARNLQRWAQAGPAHVQAWQPFLVPRMQTGLLKQLQKNPPSWCDEAAVGQELITRT